MVGPERIKKCLCRYRGCIKQRLKLVNLGAELVIAHKMFKPRHNEPTPVTHPMVHATSSLPEGPAAEGLGRLKERGLS